MRAGTRGPTHTLFAPTNPRPSTSPVSTVVGPLPGPLNLTVSANHTVPDAGSGIHAPELPAVGPNELTKDQPGSPGAGGCTIAPSGQALQEAGFMYRLTPWTGLGTPFFMRGEASIGSSQVTRTSFGPQPP